MKHYEQLNNVDKYIRIFYRARRIWQGHALQRVMDKAWVKYMDPNKRYI